MEGLESIMSEMAGKFLNLLKENGGEDMIRILIERTIEPTVYGVLEESEETETEEKEE